MAYRISYARAYSYKLLVLLLNSIFLTCVQKAKTDASFWGTLGMMNSMSVQNSVKITTLWAIIDFYSLVEEDIVN